MFALLYYGGVSVYNNREKNYWNIIEILHHTFAHKPNFINFEPWCLYVPIQYIQYIHLAMRDCTEICYSSAYIRGTKMYTKETHTCHFTTVKWYTRYTQGKSMADGCLQHTHARKHTYSHTYSYMHSCVYCLSHTHILRHFWGRRRALSGSHRNIRMWRMCLLIAANPSPCQNTLPSVSPLISHFPFLQS